MISLLGLKPRFVAGAFLVALGFATVTYVLGLRHSLALERQRSRDIELEKLNLEASLTEQVTLWRDSTQAVLVQNQQLQDLTSVLGKRAEYSAAVTARLTAKLAAITARDTTGVMSKGDTLVATFQGYVEPVTYTADVALAPDTGSLVLTVSVDTAAIVIEVGCEETTGRLRRATTVVVAPEWLEMQIAASQRADVCNQAPPKIQTDWRKVAVAGGAGALAAMMLTLIFGGR